MVRALVVLALVNGARTHHHVPALRVNPSLQREAIRHRGERHTPVRACHGERGQNLAWGFRPRGAVRAWLSSPAHRANLLDRRFRFTGIGVVRRRGLTIYTQDFAQRC